MQNLLRYNERRFDRGYNDSLKPELLPSGYAADALNCRVDNSKIDKRTGYSLVGGDIGVKRGLGLGVLERADGTKRIVAAWDDSTSTNSRYMAWTGSGSFANITGATTQTADKDVNFEQANNKLYSFNGTDASLAYDGSSASAVAAIPLGKYAKWFHNYMFVAGVSANPSRLYFSNVGNPEVWTASDYIDINPNDGDEITGLSVLGTELIITKKNRVWALTGFDVGSFTINNINERVEGFGCIAGRSFANIGNDTLFLSFVGNVPHVRSIQRTRYAVNVAGGIISDNIEGTLNGLNKTQLNKSANIFDGKVCYFAVPNASSTVNNLVVLYDTVDKGFVRWTGLNVAAWAVSTIGGRAEIYFQDSTTVSRVYKLDTSDSDNGSAIDFQYKTRAYVCRGSQGEVKSDTKAKWKYLYLTADSGNDVDLTIQASPDTYSFEDEAIVNLKGTSSVLPFVLPQPLGVPSAVRERVNIGRNPSHFMQFIFKQNEADSPVTIREYSLMFQPKKLRDA